MNTKLPTKEGQICEIIDPITGQKSEDVFIVIDNPLQFSNNDKIRVVALNDLQRNTTNPDMAERILIPKNTLNMLAEDLTSYVESWNGN
jgi:hypothetical protein